MENVNKFITELKKNTTKIIMIILIIHSSISSQRRQPTANHMKAVASLITTPNSHKFNKNNKRKKTVQHKAT